MFLYVFDAVSIRIELQQCGKPSACILSLGRIAHIPEDADYGYTRTSVAGLSVCQSVCQSVCLSVCLSVGMVCLSIGSPVKSADRSRCRLGAESVGFKEPCIRWGQGRKNPFAVMGNKSTI